MNEENESEVVSRSLLLLIRCPATKSKLTNASAELVEQLNQQVNDKTLFDQLGRPVSTPLSGGLVNEDHNLFYPVCNGIVKLVVDDAIKLSDRN